MNVAVYARVSSDAQDVELSISGQLRTIREYARKNGHTIVREFVDRAQSGRTVNRPEFRRLIEFARLSSHPVDGVLVWKFNRFARDRMDSVTYKFMLKRASVDVISTNEPVDDSPAGQMLEGIIETIDEFYSANLGQDISRGMREGASLGFFVGSVPPYGYNRKAVSVGERQRWTLEPVESEAEIVKMVFQQADSGTGLKTIASSLNELGHTTRAGKPWTNTRLHKLLTKDAYAGTVVWGKKSLARSSNSDREPVRVENAWPALVPRSQFRRVQKTLRSRRPTQLHPRIASSAYMLSGMTYCGECGGALTGHVAKSGRYHYYVCSGKSKRGAHTCRQSMVRRDALEEAVLNRTRESLLTPSNIKKLVREVNREIRQKAVGLKHRLKEVDREITEVQGRLDRYYEAFESGALGAEDLGPRVADLKELVAALEDSRARICPDSSGQRVSEAAVRRHVEDLKALLQNSDPQLRKTVLRSFIERIEVDSNQVTVEYHLPETETAGASCPAVLPIVPSGGVGGIRTRHPLPVS